MLTFLIGAAPVGTSNPLSAEAAQYGGGALGVALVIIVAYLQYRKREGGIDGKAEAAGIAMIASLRTDAESQRDRITQLEKELRERDRLARIHEDYDRRLLNMLSRSNLLDESLGVPPPLVPPFGEVAK